MTDEQPPAKPLSVFNRLIASRPLEGLLALDWAQTNRSIGAILGVSPADAWRLRHWLRGQGHPIPVGKRGRRKAAPSERNDLASAPDQPTCPPGPWRCPVCTFSADMPDALAGHLRNVHMPPLPEQEAAKFWKCPRSKCRRHRRSLHGPYTLSLHLDAHAAKMPRLGQKVNWKPRSKVEEILAAHPIDELLALDWTQTNLVLASILGAHPARVTELRRALRREGHAVPLPRRGNRGGNPHAREKYLRAGLGMVPNHVVAERLSVSKQSVHRMRTLLGSVALAARRKRQNDGGRLLPRFVLKRLVAMPREELLALDWTRKNLVLGPLLGVTPAQVSYLRSALRDEGLPIPHAKKGPPRRKA